MIAANPNYLITSVRSRFMPPTERPGDPVRRNRERPTSWSNTRSPLTAEDIRIHAWLTERLGLLRDERHGLWPRLRRVLHGNRLVRWLGLRVATLSERNG